jgi:hypothetical protein
VFQPLHAPEQLMFNQYRLDALQDGAAKGILQKMNGSEWRTLVDPNQESGDET